MERRRDPTEGTAHENEGRDAVWVLPPVFEPHLHSHRMSDDHRTLDLEMGADLMEVTRQRLDGELGSVGGRAASPVSAKVPVYDPMTSSEPRGEVPPGEAIAADSVGQHDRRLTFAELLEEQAGAVPCFDKALAVVLHAVEAYFLATSSGLSGISLTEGSLRISGRAILTQRWTIHDSERSNLADSCLMSCSIDSGK